MRNQSNNKATSSMANYALGTAILPIYTPQFPLPSSMHPHCWAVYPIWAKNKHSKPYNQPVMPTIKVKDYGLQ